MQQDRDLEWQFCQVFGEPGEEITEVDIVSAVEFDSTGEFLAAGDRGGRVVIFQRVEVIYFKNKKTKKKQFTTTPRSFKNPQSFKRSQIRNTTFSVIHTPFKSIFFLKTI